MEKIPALKGEKIDSTRRMLAIGGTAFVTGLAAKSVLQYQNETKVEENTRGLAQEEMVSVAPENVPEERVVEEVTDKEILSPSSYFEYYRNYEKKIIEKDADLVMSRFDKIELLQKHFSLPKIKDEVVRSNLEKYIIGLAFAESRFNEDAKSGQGAIGFLQLMPNTITDNIKEGEDKNDLVTQIKIAARLMERTYLHIIKTNKRDLELIREQHFAGDEVAFKEMFLTPILLNAYNAGMGTLSDIVNRFATKFPTTESLVGVFMKGEKLIDYDVFIGVTQLANINNWVDWYRDDSTRYTPRVYAAYDVVTEAIRSGGSRRKLASGE